MALYRSIIAEYTQKPSLVRSNSNPLRVGWLAMRSSLVKPDLANPKDRLPRRLPLIAGQFSAKAAKYTQQAGSPVRPIAFASCRLEN